VLSQKEVETAFSCLKMIVSTRTLSKENAVDSFVQPHAGQITGILSCFDRLILKGYLPFSYPLSMEGFLSRHGILLKDFAKLAKEQSAQLKAHARQLAEQAGRPIVPASSKTRKEDYARKLAAQDGISEGLVCIFTTQEACPSFKIARGVGRPRLVKSRPRCGVFYFYYLDRDFGLLHVRLPTWFPFTLQVYVNGHEWLARQLRNAGIGFSQRDNAFLAIDDFAKAQALADGLARVKWLRFLNALAGRVNPLLAGLLQGVAYYWVVDQAEWATDVLFKDRATLQPLYRRLLEHASLAFSAEDVLSFLGKKLHPALQAEVHTDCKKRLQGFRIKHCYGGNWLKMYDKFGLVLRIEMVINQPRCFTVCRWGNRKGQRVRGWFPLTKSIARLGRFAEISRQATHRYLDALAVVEDPRVSAQVLDRACNPVPFQGRRRRALNPLSREDQQLFFAVLRGEHIQRGFYARDIARGLGIAKSADPQEQRRRSARVSRLLQLLRAHGLIAKVQRTRRYRVTSKGFAFMSAAVYLRDKTFPTAMERTG
jgi:hypothetical protein